MRPQEESGRPPACTAYGATTAKTERESGKISQTLGVSDCTTTSKLSRAARFTLQVIALGACILTPLAAVAGLSYAVDRAPRTTIPLIILACLLFVGRVLYLEVTR